MRIQPPTGCNPTFYGGGGGHMAASSNPTAGSATIVGWGSFSGDYAGLNADILRRVDWVVATDEFYTDGRQLPGHPGGF